MLESFLQVLGDNAVSIFTPIVVAFGAWLGMVLKSNVNLKSIKTSLSIHKEVVDTAVAMVEQVYKSLDGADKFAKAKSSAIESLSSIGVAINEPQLDMLIEQSVNAIKKEVAWENIPIGIQVSEQTAQSLLENDRASLEKEEPTPTQEEIVEIPEDFPVFEGEQPVPSESFVVVDKDE